MKLKLNSGKSILISNQLCKGKNACNISLLSSEALLAHKSPIINLDKIGSYIVLEGKVLFSLGDKSKFKKSSTQTIANALVDFIRTNKLIQVNLDLSKDMLLAYVEDNATVNLVFDILSEFYAFSTYKTEYDVISVEKISLEISGEQIPEKTLENGLILTEGLNLVKDLGNAPANTVTPEHLADLASSWVKVSKKVSVEILDRKQIKKLGMGAFYAIASGATVEPRLITLQYSGATNTEQPIVLIGKGVTFDSGGISIKQAPGMDEMKMDMCGAACVLSAFLTAVKLELPINLVVIVPATENMVSSTATRPGDIITSLSGKTIEIVNTDAEGRLLLCDSLTYARDFNPKLVIDVATLTGACIVALGHTFSGVYSNNDDLLAKVIQAGNTSGDRAWHMPSDESYSIGLKGGIADLCNMPIKWNRAGASCTAAAFLEEFVDYPWAHLDVAGSAIGTGSLGEGMKKTSATSGRPFKLIMEFLKNQTV